MSYGDQFVLTLFTYDPLLAAQADAAGIDRIGIDIEHLGKDLRQASCNNWISDHAETDLERLRCCIKRATLFARCNPIHPGSADEIERLIGSGVAVLMLPYFKSVL